MAGNGTAHCFLHEKNILYFKYIYFPVGLTELFTHPHFWRGYLNIFQLAICQLVREMVRENVIGDQNVVAEVLLFYRGTQRLAVGSSGWME